LNLFELVVQLDSEIENILQDVEKVVEFGPNLLPSVAEGFVKTVVRPLTKVTKANLNEKTQIPGNCKEFACPKVNEEIWRSLPQQAKLTDLKSQQNQQLLSSTLSIFAMIANKIAENKDKIPKDIVSNILQLAIDQFQSLSSTRRGEMKKFLNPDYMGICNGKVVSFLK